MPLASIADLNRPIEETQQYFDLARTLSKLYDDFLENFEEEGHRARGLHASELNKCLKQAYYSLMGIEKKASVASQWRKRFETGHAVHGMVQRHFLRMAARYQAEELAQKNGWFLQFEDEVRISPERQELAQRYKLQSSADGVFTFREPEHGDPVLRIGLEIKTEAPDSYSDLKEPREDHIAQAHVYMAALDLPLMWFFYFNKGNQNSTPSSAPWLLPFNPHVWERLEKRAQAVLRHEAEGTEPPREEGVQCQWCPYSWKCNPLTLARKQGFISVRRPSRRP